MFIREGIQPLFTTKKDYLWVSLQTINSQPVFHRQTSPSSSYWHYWYSHYSKNQISSSNHNRLPDTKRLLYTCPHLHKLFADLPHNLDHYFHFRRGLHRKTTNTNDQRAFRGSACSLLGWGAENRVDTPVRQGMTWCFWCLTRRGSLFYELEVLLHLTQHPGTWAVFPSLAQTYGLTFHSSLPSIIHFSKPDVCLFIFVFKPSPWIIGWGSDRQDALQCITALLGSVLLQWQ